MNPNIVNKLAHCVVRGEAVQVRVSQLPDGRIFTRREQENAGHYFNDFEKLLTWLDSAERHLICKLTYAHRAEARSYGWWAETSPNHERDGHTYVLRKGGLMAPDKVVIYTDNFDIVESKLAKLKAEGADLM